MNGMINCMLERRSIRKYRPDQVLAEELNGILQAGLYAPSAGSRQSSLIVVCQNGEINDALGRINKAAFHGSASTGRVYISRDQPSIADDASIMSGFYGAPTVLTLFAPEDFLYATADCCVVAQNIMLAAHSLGIGSCMVGRAKDTFACELGRQLQGEWGIPDDYEAKIHVVLGYAADKAAAVKPRRENRIKRIV